MIKTVFHSVSHLLFPHLCNGCGSDLINGDHLLCLKCYQRLSETGFVSIPDNPVEKALWGRLICNSAMSQYYFTKDSLLQRLIHQFKYKDNKELAHYFGKLMGEALQTSARFQRPDALVPLPLFPDKEYKRGYNQAALLCEGIAAILQVPVLYNTVLRTRYTTTQTHKTRMERWQNVEGVFMCAANAELRQKKILLVDDVITTGATIEACGNAILEDVPDVQLSIATLAYAAA
ncbi:ComF family protein [Agriterribacter sp.]|uniref:ComF family protein n=1 Tax=Agriterribacter sp. TaxID=2821509 RepID=UPI002B69BA12|nr:ComF family protein [Agriterribacter sp.]HRO46881.1 ComF family protein [Agriterribacter sp.]HRQ18218.1 ComF family protein [Agriterribacter sp.]